MTGVRRALRDYDRRHGYRGPVDRRQDWPRRGSRPPGMRSSTSIRALRSSISRSWSQPAVRRRRCISTSGDARSSPSRTRSWARQYVDENHAGPRPARDVRGAPAGRRRLRAAPDKERWQLAQPPHAQGAFVALDPQDGAVLALVGGYDFALEQVQSRGAGAPPAGLVVQALRLFGRARARLHAGDARARTRPSCSSTRGWRRCGDRRTTRASSAGPLRLREALVKSRNLVSIRVLKAVGVPDAIEHLQRFGFTSDELPHNLSLALGTRDALAAADGVRVRGARERRLSDRRATTSSASRTRPARSCSRPIRSSCAPRARRRIERVTSPLLERGGSRRSRRRRPRTASRRRAGSPRSGRSGSRPRRSRRRTPISSPT